MIVSELFHITPWKIEANNFQKKSKILNEFDKILGTYTVKRGDTLTKIVKNELNKHGISLPYFELNQLVEKIAKENNITNPDLIYPGQKIFFNIANINRKFLFPVNGIISSKYGMRVDPFTKHMRFHEGIDIAAPIGTPVKAAISGEVIFSGWIRGYGNIVIIKNGDIITKYAHNSVLLVNKGEYVKKGEIIAKVGSTGRSTGPHLHFEVLVNNRHVDPLKFFKI